MCRFILFLFFFKQKTAYEMRISDWSSDVCSSDLDGENWVEIQHILRGHKARSRPLNAEMSMGQTIDDDPVYPGRISNNVYSEEAARGFYAQWLRDRKSVV